MQRKEICQCNNSKPLLLLPATTARLASVCVCVCVLESFLRHRNLDKYYNVRSSDSNSRRRANDITRVKR